MTELFKVIPSLTKCALEEIINPTRAKLSRTDYVFNYFKGLQKDLGIKNVALVRELEYVDKCYLRDYSKYYSESFFDYKRYSERVHFFSHENLDDGVFSEILKNGKDEELAALRGDNYLGYITVKPVTDPYNSKLLGRSAFAHYSDKDSDGNTRNYLKISNYRNSCSLFGIDLNINSVPFHEQDIAVGACASACLWMTQFVIEDWFNIPFKSLAEITMMSRLQSRNSPPTPIYPSSGLAPAEIVNYLQQINIYYHIIDIKQLIEKIKKSQLEITENVVFDDIIKAYFSVNFPMICGLKFETKQSDPIYHAVLLSGYKQDKKGKIIQLYIHDDRIGPYCRTKFRENKLDWGNQWTESKKVEKISLYKLIIPVHPLVKLSFVRSIIQYYKYKEKFNVNGDFSLYLINDYKEEIMKEDIKDKTDFLSSNMPRYIWLSREYDNNGNPIQDSIYDATRTLLRDKKYEIEYQ